MKVKQQVKARINLFDENEIKLKFGDENKFKLKFGESENECDIRAFTRSRKKKARKVKSRVE